MKIRKLSLAIAVAALFSSGLSVASGSIGASAPRAQGGKSYSMGKAVYFKKIACADCKVPGGVANPADAKSLAMRIETDEFNLSDKERTDAKAYLMRRFKLN